MNRLHSYIAVWKLTALNAFQEAFINRWSNLLFFIGKLLRLGMMLLFLWLIKENVHQFSGYTTDQLILFFLTYQLVDLTSQIMYRGVYLFTHYIRSGDFDFILAQPISPLFRMLTAKPDINDTFFLIPTLAISAVIISNLSIEVTVQSLFWFLILLVNSFLLATAFHIVVLAIGILATEVDGIIWLYRDISRLAQFPVTVYLQPLRFALFFLVPVGMMITLPAEVLINQPTHSITIATFVGISFLTFSYILWKWSIKQYTSASS